MSTLLGTNRVLGNGQLELIPPAGFDSTKSLRLANTSSDTLIVTNVSSVGQSREYLLPGQQMVYRSPNVSSPITIIGLTLAATAIAAVLFSEWGTDEICENDFPGTYPVLVPKNNLSSFGIFMPETYGPTGTVNDGASIRAAASAANTAGGGMVYLQKMYNTDQVIHYANVVFAGAVRAINGFKAIAALNRDVVITDNFAANTGTTNNGPSGFALRHMTIDGNRTNQTALTRCWVVYGYNYTLDDVWLVSGWGGNYYSEWGGTAALEESYIDSLKVWDFGGTPGSVGIDWNGPHDTQWGEVIVATLDSTIRPTDVAYGATPINGTGVNFPGSGIPFTFLTSAAAPIALFPTTGGSFVVPSQNNLPTWVNVTYTSAATVGTVTTFSGCLAGAFASYTVPANGGIVLPTFGVRINGGSGNHNESALQIDRIHTWGRLHFGFIPWNSCSFFVSNGECEGAFITNVVMSSHSVYRGAVFGTNGQVGQTNEAGIQLGSYGGTSIDGGQCQVDATAYNLGGASSVNGCSAQTVNSSTSAQVKVTGQTSHPTRYVRVTAGDNYEAVCHGNAALSVYQYSVNHSYPDTAATYSASIAINPNAARWVPITVTNATNFAITITGVAPSNQTVEFTIEVFNNSGGAMGTITWMGTSIFPNGAWVNPATGKKRYATFSYLGSSVQFICTSMAANDY